MSSHTRRLRHLNNDTKHCILTSSRCVLQRHSLFVWQKPTSVKMFGSYPYPPNLYEHNTVGFINMMARRWGHLSRDVSTRSSWPARPTR